MQKDMTRGPILPLILEFLFPMFVGNVFQQLYNMADMIIVGRYVGAGALAAVGSAGTLMFLVLGFALGITAGFGILTSQRFGARDEAGVRRSVANGTLLALLLSLAMTLLSTAAVPWLLELLNTPADIWNDARTYITIISRGFSPTYSTTWLPCSSGPWGTAKPRCSSWCFPPASMWGWICC